MGWSKYRQIFKYTRRYTALKSYSVSFEYRIGRWYWTLGKRKGKVSKTQYEAQRSAEKYILEKEKILVDNAGI